MLLDSMTPIRQIFSFSQERRRFRRISVSTTVMPFNSLSSHQCILAAWSKYSGRLDWFSHASRDYQRAGHHSPHSFCNHRKCTLNLELQSLETSQSGQGNLVIDWQPPEPCSTPASATPSGAVVLEDGTGSTQGSQQLEEPWCGFEDRWFLITQPANTNLEIMASTA